MDTTNTREVKRGEKNPLTEYFKIPGYGKYVLLFGFLSAIKDKVDFHNNIIPNSTSAPIIFATLILIDGFGVFFIIMWIVSIIRRLRKVNNPYSKKIERTAKVVLLFVVCVLIISFVLNLIGIQSTGKLGVV